MKQFHPHSRTLEEYPVRGGTAATWDTRSDVRVAKQGGSYFMAQSKKMLLKRIDRLSRHLHPQVKRVAAQRFDEDLLEEFSLIWGNAGCFRAELQRAHRGDLQHVSSFLVTYQKVQGLYEELQTFAQKVLSYR